MSQNSKIEWTDHTANFWTGCVKVSAGCEHCYAEMLSRRFGKNVWGPAKTTTRVRGKAIWEDILKWDARAKAERIRRRVFVSSMSDFLEDHPMVDEWRTDAMKIIESLEWLDVLILTKRPENIHLISRWIPGFPQHVWMGTSVENQATAEKRIHHLLDIPARIHFLSVEPQLERIDLDLRGRNYGIDYPTYSEDIDWVICGGESGAKHRPFNVEWARDLRDQCRAANVAFFMKQLGGHPSKRDQMSDFPEDLRVREFPVARVEQEIIQNIVRNQQAIQTVIDADKAKAAK
jgi:protein gp37